MKSWIHAIVVSLLLVAAVPNANALEVGNQEYDLILELDMLGNFGMWHDMQMYSTYGFAGPELVDEVEFAAPVFDGVAVAGFYASGGLVDSTHTSDIATGSFTLYDENNNELLTTEYLGEGEVGHTYGNPQLTAHGLFEITGGLLYDQNLLEGQIYLSMTYIITHISGNHQDVYAANGMVSLYAPAGGGGGGGNGGGDTEVPEPASLLLLVSGVCGLLRAKKQV